MTKRIDAAIAAMKPYEKLLETAVCSWGGFTPTGGDIKHHGAICLGALGYHGITFKTLWHYHRPKTKAEVSKAWLRAMIDPSTSPWRQLIEAQDEQDFDDVYRHGYVLTDIEFPSNYVVNFLMAFRLSQEYPWKANLWHKLTQDGVSFGTAVSVVGIVASYNAISDTFIPTAGDVGHYAFSWCAGDVDYPHRITNGTPVEKLLSKHMFSKNTAYLPCNVIWGNGNTSHAVLELHKFLKNYKKKSTGKSRFANPSDDPAVGYSYDGLLAFCQKVDKGAKND